MSNSEDWAEHMRRNYRNRVAEALRATREACASAKHLGINSTALQRAVAAIKFQLELDEAEDQS